MKKGVLILLGMFMMVSTIEAKNSDNLPDRFGFNYSYDNAVNFIERGVEFFIFTNGEFDFNTAFYDFDGRRNRRNIDVRIDRDFRGRIRRVGSTFINYDRFGNVTRIGDVLIRYRRGRLANVGNLRVRYNTWGNPIFYGNVRNNFHTFNGVRFNLNIGDICDYNDAYFFRNDFRRNYSQIREDRNFYYYRANNNARIGNRSQILRRRKPSSVNTNRRVTASTRKSKSSYRKSPVKNSTREIRNERRNNTTNNYSKSSIDSKKRIISETGRRKSTSITLRKSNTPKNERVTRTKKIEKRNNTERTRRKS